MRNPLIILDDATIIQTIGDAHLGRSFVNGVPLDKRGVFEARIRDEFVKLLNPKAADIVVQVGDIFDKFNVDNAHVEFAAREILKAARGSPDIIFVFMRGNHDASKDTTKTSSFDILKMLLEEAQLNNLWVVDGVTTIRNCAFIGWSPEHSAAALANLLSGKFDAVFGHWDVNLPEQADHFNMVPVEELKDKTKLIVTGHDHKPDTIERGDVTIIKTGSVVPMAHGEETEEDALIYTLTPDEYDASVHDGKIVRFILEDDQEVPEGNFLQVKVIPKLKKTEEESEPEPDSMDLPQVLQGYLVAKGVPDELATTVVERFRQRNVDQS